ncbi:hypothetical protein BJP36_41910 [Moorena producens JHB]|uniref:Uncharacterized protein n=1 Tax=Moorena producens (strain JHB) TaxID=1454205 RepID=A0A9Q9SSP4_MOOP1|nr:hypothetical protein [Moorena producens]WAN68922.1 hypothetical protein BJP36_41910 [Moorena producens JHB]
MEIPVDRAIEVTYSYTDSLTVGFLPTPPNGIRFRRRCANGYSASFINDTGCPDPPEQYKKKVRF